MDNVVIAFDIASRTDPLVKFSIVSTLFLLFWVLVMRSRIEFSGKILMSVVPAVALAVSCFELARDWPAERRVSREAERGLQEVVGVFSAAAPPNFTIGGRAFELTSARYPAFTGDRDTLRDVIGQCVKARHTAARDIVRLEILAPTQCEISDRG